MVALSSLNILGELNTVVVEVDHRSHCFAFGSCCLLVFDFMVGRGGRGEGELEWVFAMKMQGEGTGVGMEKIQVEEEEFLTFSEFILSFSKCFWMLIKLNVFGFFFPEN